MISSVGVVMISKDDCINCVRAENQLQNNNVHYEYINVSDPNNYKMLDYIKKQGYRSVPLIFFNGDYIGDHTSISKLITKINE